LPTAQCLRSAVVVNGAIKIKSKAKQSKSEAGFGLIYFFWLYLIQLWERACSRCGGAGALDADWSTAIASRLAPTGDWWWRGVCEQL